PLAGTYHLTLTATTKNGTRSITSPLQVAGSPEIVITRTAATRLWPFAPSPMDITVRFGREVSGTVTDIVPPDFVISRLKPEGTIEKQPDGSTLIRWEGSWRQGASAAFHYDYDAPDISPQFYLIGPLRIEGSTDS